MSNDTPNFNGFPTDNSSSTNLKYDIIASKFITGVRNHSKYNTATKSSDCVLYLIFALLELAGAIVLITFVALKWIWKYYNKCNEV